MATRAEGQLWIDRKAPHGLKYFTDGETFQVGLSKEYNASGNVSAGTVVAIDTTAEADSYKFVPAKFPKDIHQVLGVCPKNMTEGSKTSILRDGYLTLELPNPTIDAAGFEIQDVLVQRPNDLILNNSNLDIKGAPVYWFIGRSYKVEGGAPVYPYADPSDYVGKITLSTPSGMRWGLTSRFTGDDNSFNVGYDNLPVIGTVVGYEYYSTLQGILKSLTININVPYFEESLGWHWPYCSLFGTSGQAPKAASVVESSDPDDGYKYIRVRHGLFCNPGNDSSSPWYSFRPRGYCDIISLNENDDYETVVRAHVDNYYGLGEQSPASSDKRTEIALKKYNSSDKKRFNISGRVVYTFDKQA